MTDSRWRLPAEPLRSSVIASHAAALAGAVGLAALAHRALPLSAAYPIKTAALLGAIELLALGRIQQHHPFPRFGPANQVTTVRIALVALVASLIGEPSAQAVAGGAVVASLVVTVLDGMDGWLSRQTGTASAFGARFDMETDALLIQVLAILAWRYDKAGAWVLMSGLLRYLFVAAGWMWSWIERPLFPSFRRKLICVVQIVGLVLAIAPFVPRSLSAPIAALSLAALVYSFFVDTLWLWRHRPRRAAET